MKNVEYPTNLHNVEVIEKVDDALAAIYAESGTLTSQSAIEMGQRALTLSGGECRA